MEIEEGCVDDCTCDAGGADAQPAKTSNAAHRARVPTRDALGRAGKHPMVSTIGGCIERLVVWVRCGVHGPPHVNSIASEITSPPCLREK